ncbi:hypothetical protein MMC11_006352 [Xylographa trunciseda]|nr:hypothetical protein [Xylographa trunciseda]
MALVPPAIFGPDSWKDNEKCHSLISRSATRCNNNTNWDEVATTCSRLRTGVPCAVSKRFTVDWQYLLKLIDFDDGVRWVIHIPLDYTGPGLSACIADRMSRKVAAYKFLKQKTAIPVPDVHGYNVNIDPRIGSPYILLTYVDGVLAANLDDHPEKSRHVQQQVIKMMIDLASHKFDKVGSLAIDEDGQYYIGKDMDIDAGPFRTAEGYYNALSIHHFHDFTKYHFRDNALAENCPAVHLPFMFNNYMRIYTDCANDYGPFPLVHAGFGERNIVLDSEGNIICVNDVDNIMAAPIPVVAQLPQICVLNSPPPGLNITNSSRSIVYDNTLPECTRFVKMFKAEEERHNPLTPIANSMLSDAARLMEGLNAYGQMSIRCGNEWVRSFLYMYYRSQDGKAFFGPHADTKAKMYPGNMDAKEFSDGLKLDDDKEIEAEAGRSSFTSPYPGGKESDELDTEPVSPISPNVPKRKHIAAHLGLTEAEQEDVMRLHRALLIDRAQLIPNKTAVVNPQTKSSMYDHQFVLLRPPVGEAVDERLIRTKSSSRLSDFLRSANRSVVSLQQPIPIKLARMRSIRRAFSATSFRTALGVPKTDEHIGLALLPARFSSPDPEQFRHDQTAYGMNVSEGKSVTDESRSVTEDAARMALDDDGDVYHDAATVQEEHRDSGVYDEAHPLLRVSRA